VNLVLDASIALSWCFEDQGSEEALQTLERLRSNEAVVPPLWTLEVANGLLTAERQRRLDAEAMARAGHLLLSLPIVVEPAARARPLTTVLPLARKHRLSAYDGAYLELALRRNIPLATLDRSLRRAARSEGVEVALG
jgi:predicted nucleic acid-binding protein